MNIFITGGSGFLGQQVLKRLARDYSQISGLARSDNSANKLSLLNVTPVQGSLENIASWQASLSTIDIVIHCAAPVDFWGDWQKYQTGIVTATTALYKAAEAAGVKRFIYISSESVLQDKKDLVDIDESEPYPTVPNSNYGKAKMLAEQFILAQDSTMVSIIIRPTFIWGPGVKAVKTMVAKVKSGDFIWINHGQSLMEMVHVDNVAEAIALACSKGASKSIYFVTDDNSQTVKTFLTKLLKTQGIMPSGKSLPKGLASLLASVIEPCWRLLGLQKPPPISHFDLAFVAMSRRYKIDNIKNELDYQPVILEAEGLAKMALEYKK